MDSWIAIASDGNVTAYTGKVEIGQGMSIAQTQLVAEELSVPLERVKLIFGDTSMTPDQGVTSGSQSTPSNFNHSNLAQAGATAQPRSTANGRRKNWKFPSKASKLPMASFRSRATRPGKLHDGQLVAGKKFGVKLDGKALRKPPLRMDSAQEIGAAPGL